MRARLSIPRVRSATLCLFTLSLLLGCAGSDAAATGGEGGGATHGASSAGHSTSGADTSASSGHGSSTEAATSSSAGGAGGGAGGQGGGGAAPCATRVTYGDAWIHGAGHPQDFDDVAGPLTWDGVCVDDGANSYATLSNGWKPYFSGHSACVVALDTTCAGAPACSTRVSYGAGWLPAPNHPDAFDDVAGRVTWDRACPTDGANAYGALSNGWAPHFAGHGACAMSFTYTNCGGLYQNAVYPSCADPGVLHDGADYFAACTSGGAAEAYPIFHSTDLTSWSLAGHIFPTGTKPTWATGDFWAPEIHRIGSKYVAYFSARDTDGKLSIGAAKGDAPLGPFTDIGHPLVHDASVGLIDVDAFLDAGGAPFLVWKVDGNATGAHTPIYGQALSSDGAALTGPRATLITNDLAWEGGVVEGPWVYPHGGSYYLFYSGNAYYDGRYAVGVARASSPLGPYTKRGDPILVTNGTWVGPGHCSVVPGPHGDQDVMVYHAWKTGHVNGAGDARNLLVDAIVWGDDGWPRVPEAPSTTSRPMP